MSGSSSDDHVFLVHLETAERGPRLAVKDLIDVAGTPTTCGSRAVAEHAQPAERDAACVARARDAGAQVVGKVNLHELGIGSSGVNEAFGTPRNPRDPDRVPGGSSSGSAVAVATGAADVALGTDTGGSCRIPAACCGVAGLKTTWRRIPTEGVRPLAPSLDTVGPLAADVHGLVVGMGLLDPAFARSDRTPSRLGRLRPPADPVIDAAVDRALAATDFEVVDITLSGWNRAITDAIVVLLAETAQTSADLLEHRDRLGSDVIAKIEAAIALPTDLLPAARDGLERWRAELAACFEDVEIIALPTLPIAPPTLAESALAEGDLARLTLAANAARVPALALPVPSEGPLPASLQLVGPEESEALLLAAGQHVEDAIARP